MNPLIFLQWQRNVTAYRRKTDTLFFTRFDSYPLHYKYLEEAGFYIKNCLMVEKGTVGGIGDFTNISQPHALSHLHVSLKISSVHKSLPFFCFAVRYSLTGGISSP